VLANRFAKVLARPGAAGARRMAIAILGALEAKPQPSDDEIAIVADHAFVWVGVGLAKRARALIERWQRGGVRTQALGRADAIFTVAIAPPAAAGRLRALAGDPVAGAVAVANHVFRGELRAAIERCVAEGWFLTEPTAISGVAYGVWAQAMLDDFDGALAVIATWRNRHKTLLPVAEQALLAAEARIESVRHHHTRERALLEEALAVCDDHRLGLERAYVEASLAIALARAGDVRAAAAIARRWPTPSPGREKEQALAVYRDVARTEIALIDGRYREADAIARRVLAYATANGNAIYACLARSHRAFAATRPQLHARLAEYGRDAAQLQIPFHLRRHLLLARLAESDATGAVGASPRDRHVFVRTRSLRANHKTSSSRPAGASMTGAIASDHRRPERVLRLCLPSAADLGADLYWDAVQGVLYLSGDGPFTLAEHPILRRALETILGSPAFAIPLSDLFEAVWSMDYRPLVHEVKIHVALHRLRALLAGWHAGGDRLIVVRDGIVRIADDCRACVVELAPAHATEAPASSLFDRVAAHLAATGEATPVELAARIGASRSALVVALRSLVLERRVVRIGRGRATRYRAAT
jgi:hypothetical protein